MAKRGCLPPSLPYFTTSSEYVNNRYGISCAKMANLRRPCPILTSAKRRPQSGFTEITTVAAARHHFIRHFIRSWMKGSVQAKYAKSTRYPVYR